MRSFSHGQTEISSQRAQFVCNAWEASERGGTWVRKTVKAYAHSEVRRLARHDDCRFSLPARSRNRNLLETQIGLQTSELIE